MTREAHIWTADKLDFLELYIPAFIKATRKALGRYYVDGFAGPGRNYIKGLGGRDGSPLIALNSAGDFTTYFFVEKKRENHRLLQEHVSLHPRSSKAVIQRGDFNQLAPQILAQIPDLAPALFFLDPEGLELDFATVRRISNRTKADIFILISSSGVIRNRTKPDVYERLTRFYGSDVWLQVRDKYDRREYPTATKAFEAFTDLYLEQLAGLGFSIVDRYLIARTRTNVALHALVFAIKSDKPEAALKIAQSILKDLQTRVQGRLF